MDYKVQSVIFLKSKWTETTASDWLLENSYKIKKEDVTEKYLRFRQINPDYLKRVGYTHFVNKDIGKGIHLIIAYKKQQGGAVSASNVKRFVEASYKKKQMKILMITSWINLYQMTTQKLITTQKQIKQL